MATLSRQELLVQVWIERMGGRRRHAGGGWHAIRRRRLCQQGVATRFRQIGQTLSR